MTTDEIRRRFLDFFRKRGHEIAPSASLIPEDDPTLLFTGAGMNQFKDNFLGRNITYTRAASCQKCLRTADLERVGRTPGHHTFFEMLGNFSFGDYFKKEAILWAWEFLTQNLKLKTQNLWVSVYIDDTEAYDVWKDLIKVPKEKIIKLGDKENFWPSEAPTKGPNGPCGPCSEIFYDSGKDVGCKRPECDPSCDCGRFVEVWNLVFTQFDRQPDGSLKPLPNKNIDTGMGLERLASIMQGVRTNFEIDIFKPVVEEIERGLRVKGQGSRPKINAIADHIRAVVFAIADGVMPLNEGRGYVVRKLIRRSLSHAKDLNIDETFLYKLVSSVVKAMEGPYPELASRRDDIAQIVKKEEENFLFVIETQLPKVEEAFGKLSCQLSVVSCQEKLAEAAFNFYDTYGMPYDILEEVARKYGLKMDEDAFNKLLEKQKTLSRSKSKIRAEIFSETFAKKVESLNLKTEFLGYERSHSDAKVLAVLDGGEVILDKTPFYGESGGQTGDWGRIETPSGEIEVIDAKKIGETIVHIGMAVRGKILAGERAHVSIDEVARKDVMRNHTATHLLQAALKKVLGEHVRQTGSLVDDKHLRFDFTHMKKLDPREIARVEDIVNENIKKALAVKKEIKELETARKEGAIALFGEKYQKRVRVVSIDGVSKELCGGTHVDNTKDIELFKITSESSIASGVRRIEALTAGAAREWIERQKEIQNSKLKTQSEKEEKKKRLEKHLKEEIEKIDSYLAKATDIGGVKIVNEVIPDVDMEALRTLSDRMRSKEKSAIIILATKDENKVSFIISLTEDLVKERRLNASDLAKEFAKAIDGSGGGRADFAQGGGKDPSRFDEAIRKICEILKERAL